MPEHQRKRTWQAMNEGLTDAELHDNTENPESNDTGSAHSLSDAMSIREDQTTSMEAGMMEDGDGYEEEEDTSLQDGKGYKEEATNSMRAEVEAHGKRRRRKGTQRNPFLDMEALDVDTSDEEDHEADIKNESFIDEGDGNNSDNSDNDRHIKDHQEHCHLLQSSNGAANQEYWDALLEWAYGRTKQHSGPLCLGVDDDDEYVISPQDLLWKVPCKAGHEMEAVFSIFNRATHPTSPNVVGPSATFNPSHPGRIYLEAPGEAAARAMVEGISGLFLSCLKLVPPDQRYHAMSPSPRSVPLWVRIHDFRKKWRHVNWTVGIIVPLLNEFGIEVIWQVIVAFKDAECASPGWRWAAVRLDDIRFTIGIGQLPTVDDVQRFSGCPLVNEYSLSVLYECIYRTNIRPGARVKVTRGAFKGSAGYVVEVSDAMADIQTQDGSLETVPIKCIRRHFMVGDEVSIVTTPWRGVIGWVVRIEGQIITIWSDKEFREYRVAAIEAEFFCSSESFQRAAQIPTQGPRLKMTKHDPYARYKGRSVAITGQHPFKGHRGRICETHHDGRIWVQMESVLNGNRMLQFRHHNVSIIEDDTNVLHPLSQSHESQMPQPSPLPFSISISQDSVANTDSSSSSKVVGSLLLDNLPVVDDSIDFPKTEDVAPMPIEDPYWLVDACFKQRIKLSHLHDPHHIVQLVGRGSHPGMVQIRDRKGHVVEMGVQLLSALPPEQPNDFVVVLRGEKAGTLYKVVEVREFETTVKISGRVKRKNHVDPIFSNNNLVQAYGAFK
ncbi:hypothetical protein CVT24_012424 [Panaeolus cyanescens]|uniref:Chromatin elongation factor SPT5 n=1 Tax=Panaeolus cyanescens TaxID=181874 RepID=A0A409WU97_9AGAR|nr:hypothetical protein CVT24_012424 [Panaeolus cyanescens]